MRRFRGAIPFLLISPILSGCGHVGEKTASISVIYGAVAAIALLLLAGYVLTDKKRDPWYLLLFSSISVVNIGYFLLSVSRSLEAALWANRLAYLGSVFLPLSMWMIILKVTRIHFPRWLRNALLALAGVVFLIAATPGYLSIYYRSVSFEAANGVGTLQKVYGPLHFLYLIYLLGYFTAMVVSIVQATLKDKIDSTAHAAILAMAVFVNIGVWLIEQLVSIDFEILSVSYIISECFLLGLRSLISEAEKKTPSQASTAGVSKAETSDTEDPELLSIFVHGLTELTPKERALYECYIAGMPTDLIMETLSIKENTLKFHSKNLYSKLGVRSRKQLMEIHRKLPKT